MEIVTVEYIKTLVSDRDRQNIYHKIELLFQSVLKNGLSIVVIIIEANLLQKIKISKITFMYKQGLCLLSCNNKDELTEILEIIKRINIWHISSVQFLIGSGSLQKEINKYDVEHELSLRNIQNNTLLKEISNHVVGAIYPLDNDLNIYGNGLFRKIIEENEI